MNAEAKSRIRTPVTLVTGFLGSGKTTFINAALKAPELARTAVVVNEFGERGLDHQLYARSDDAVIVLENGCLCCTVRSDLVSTLNELYHSRQAGSVPDFDHVVIETSGLAEPGPVLQAFLSEPTLDGLYRVSRVITLVDAVNWWATSEAHDESVRQVALADRILITKLDLVEGDKAAAEARLRDDLKRLNPAAVIAAVDWSTAAIATLLTAPGFDAANPQANPLPWLSLEAYAPHGHHSHDETRDDDHAHHDHFAGRDVESFVLVRDEPLSRDELQFLLDGIAQNLGTGLLRVKGLVNVAGEPGRPAVIQGVQHLLHTMTWLDTWPSGDTTTRVVFITQGIVRDRLAQIIETLDRVSSRTFKAREKGRLAREAEEKARQTEDGAQ